MKRFFYILTLFVAYFANVEFGCSQNLSVQDSVFNLYIDFVRSASAKLKTENSANFLKALEVALLSDSKGQLAFDSLFKYKALIQTPDKQVRIFTWDVEADDGTHTYYGFIHAYIKKFKKYELYKLTDKSEGIRDPENAVLDNTKWFGAYYYEIIPVKYRKKIQYVLLGWDGNSRISNKRLIDVLYFSDKGFPKFGASVFSNEQGKIKKRIIFEFQSELFMSLKYDASKESIMFDHLSPSNPSLEGQYSFYGPDFSYDMLQFKKGKWIYLKDVLPRNGKDKSDKYFNSPK